MWVISSPGSILEGESRWLKPGKTYTIGRRNDADFSIDVKSVSRHQAEITLGSVEPGASKILSKRPTITLTDLTKKQKTYIDGVQIQNSKALLSQTSDSITIEFGNRESTDGTMEIKWKPIVISFSSRDESTAESAEWTSKLEPMDVKFSTEVASTSLCFLKSTSTMTSRALIAVVLGLPIVTPKYIEALYQCQSSLETGSFDVAFPDPLLFSAEVDLIPDTRRKTLFTGMTFAFWDRDQYNQVKPVITATGGRAILQDTQNETISIRKLAEFIQEQAVKASEGLVSAEKAILSGAIIPVKLLIETPDLKATELLVKINTATKALGLCLMDQHMIAKSIKSVSTKHMFRLRPGGPMLDLLNEKKTTTPAIKNENKPVSQRNTNIMDFFGATSTRNSNGSKENNAITGTSQIPRIPKPSQSVVKFENPFFAPPTVRSTIDEKEATIPPRKTAGSFVSKDTKKNKATSGTDSQNIFTFFTQGTAPLPAPKSQQQPEKSMEAQSDINISAEHSQKRSAEDSIQNDATAIEEATLAATEFKRRKLVHDNADTGNEQIDDLYDEMEEVQPAIPEKPKITFAEALRVTKKEQADAYSYNELGGGAQEGISDLDVTGMKNLALVENSVQLRPPSREKQAAPLGDKWVGRPNFKKFRRNRLNKTDIIGDNYNGEATSARIITLVEVNPHQMRIQSDVDWLKHDPRSHPYRGNENENQTGIEEDVQPSEESLFVGGGLSSSEEEDDDEIEMTSFRKSSSRSRSGSAKPKSFSVNNSASSITTGGSSTPQMRDSSTRKTRGSGTRKEQIYIDDDDDNDDDENDGLGFRFSK